MTKENFEKTVDLVKELMKDMENGEFTTSDIDIVKENYISLLKEIEDNEYNLNIPRYIDSFEDEDNIDLKSIREEIRKLEAERDSLDSSIAKILKDIKL